jgi:predicted glycosyltransferase
MGGYNTVCELACAGARALLVPRTHPRREQWLRARLLAARGVVDFIDGELPSPDELMARVQRGLQAAAPPRGWNLDFRGLERSVSVVERSRPLPAAAVASVAGRAV